MRSQPTPVTSPQMQQSNPRLHIGKVKSRSHLSMSYRCHHDLELGYYNQILLVYDICQFGVWIIVLIVQYGNNMPNAVINVFTTINNRKGRSDDKSGGQCQWYKKYDIEEDNSYTRTIRRRRRMCTKRMRADDKKEENPGFCYYFWIITGWLMCFLWYYILCLILLQVQIIKHASNHLSAYGCVVIDAISDENVCGEVKCNNVMHFVDVVVHDDDNDRSKRRRH